MIAEIIPLLRLPQAINVLDYIIPETLAPILLPGHLVSIPFRNKEILGIVSACNHDTSSTITKLKPISRLVNPEPLLSASLLSLTKTMAELYGVSWSTIMLMWMPPLKKRRLQQTVFLPFQNDTILPSKKISGIQAYCLYYSKQERTTWYHTYSQGCVYFVVPRITDIQERFDQLSPELQKQTLIWHSELTEKEKFERWCAWRNGQYTQVIGTRSVLFLVPFNKMTTIIIDEEHDEQHKHWDQTPRYHTKDIARLWQEFFNVHLIYMSFTPSVEAYYSLHREQVPLLGQQSLCAPWPQPTILEHTTDPGHPEPLSPTLLEALDSIGEHDDAFFWVQRRGYAHTLTCRDCAWYATCPQCMLPYHVTAGQKKICCVGCQTTLPSPSVCPRCQSVKLITYGYGVDQIAEKIIAHCKKIHTHEISIITADTTVFSEKNKPKIIIGTSAALPYLRWHATTLLALVDFDRQISLPEFSASEEVRNSIQTIRFHLHPSAQYYIQTKRPDHLIFRSFSEPDRWYRTELNQRRAIGLPPYQRVIRFIYGNTQAARSQEQAQLLYLILKKILTTSDFSSTLQGPLPLEPARFRNAYWYALIVKVHPEKYQRMLSIITPHIPPGWRYDPRPHTFFGH